MPRHRIQAHYYQLLESEKELIFGLKEARWAKRRVIRHMGLSKVATKRCLQEWLDNSRFQCHDDSGRRKVTADRENRLTVKSGVTGPDSSLSTIRRATPTRVLNLTILRRLIERNLR
ncbi:uncharacterized protein TNCV_4210721 [Trichonephila clavipes]|nr:uncharacterized protein TNCV_4210721 [Trichonephila clavipes]